MKVKLFYGNTVEDEDAGALVFAPYSDAHGPHIRTIPDEHGANCMLLFSRDEIILLKDWCDNVLKRE